MVNEEGDAALQEYQKLLLKRINFMEYDGHKKIVKKKLEKIVALFQNAHSIIEDDTIDSKISDERFEKLLIENYAFKNILFQLMVKEAIPVTRERYLQQTRLRRLKLLSYQQGSKMLQQNQKSDVVFSDVELLFKH